MRYLILAFLRYLPRRRGLSALQLLGVSFGVAAVVGMHLSSAAALQSLFRAVDFLRGGATHTIRRSSGPMAETVVAGLARDGAVRRLAPVLEGRVRIDGGEVVRLFGVDSFLDRSLRPGFYRTQGRPEEEDFLREFILADRAVLAGRSLAERLAVERGGTVETGRGSLKVVGIFDDPAGEPLLIMDIAAAQNLLGRHGVVDRVDLVLDDAAGFRERWETGFVVQSAGAQGRSLGGMFRAFRLNMQALSLMALFVGVFLVYNTATFTVVSRRRDGGILRSLGATRGEVAAAFLAEVTLTGLAGGVLGGMLGYLLSRLLAGVVGETVSNLYFTLSPAAVEWSWAHAGAGGLIGVGASLAGSAWPLLEISRSDPVSTLHGRVPSRSSFRVAAAAALWGCALMAASVGLSFIRKLGIGGGFAAAFGFLAGASLLGGVAVAAAAPLLGTAAGALWGMPGRMAARVLRRNLGRTSVAVSAFMVALSLTIGLGAMIGSFRSSLLRWMEGQLLGEVYVGSAPETTVPDALYEEILALDGVAGIDRYRNEEGFYRGERVRVAAVDAAVLQEHSRFLWKEGGRENWTPVMEGAVVVSESFLLRFGVGRGDRVTLEGRNGREALPVAAVFTDYSTEHGLIMMDRTTYERLYEDRETDTLGIFFEKNASEDLPGIIAEIAAGRGLSSWTRNEFFERVLAVFDSTFAVTRSMRLMAIVIALFGITGALLTLFMERRREFGIYRALGFSVSQVAVMSLLEGVFLGATSFFLAVPAGSVLAWLLIEVINVRSFNWRIVHTLAAEPYVLAAGTALAAGALASAYPVWKILRTYPHLQLREE